MVALEALKRIKNIKYGKGKLSNYIDFMEDFETIEKELKHYQQYDIVLEEYEKGNIKPYFTNWWKLEIEPKLKALEIIKKKKVNVFTLCECCSWHNPSHYNDSIGCPVNCELTQEEYDLLKEVLLCEAKAK